jgi:hypothetical protein
MRSSDLRDRYIERVVTSRSFVDVGGLWGETEERGSVAHRHGASAVTMLDVLPEGNEWWQRFHERMSRLGVEKVQCIVGDVNEMEGGRYDVVHSSGVLYHVPNPIAYLATLRGLAREHVILTSAIVPSRVLNRFGRLRVRDGTALFVPALSERDKRIYAHFFTRGDPNLLLGGINTDNAFVPHNYSPWWWLLPPGTIRSMVECAGFEVLDDGPNWNGHGHTFLLRPSGRSDIEAQG